ncbi:hypothetical protein [Argonema antarcticum]|uniref:hypothetical protein n=1 Tax=Argonema antarcticum TaxID=2942763 RepID=UPI0020133F74|nr:hypothetical protein [Argonema antarcticum]MCL1471362.1 hypothetical protein [Argonema antarcticum A004/B2]
MAQKTAPKTIRTDKWQISPTSEQKQYMLNTVREYRRLCRFLVTVICTHWPDLGSKSCDNLVPAVEKLVHKTTKNPDPKYPQINRAFHKFPSYLRRAAISFASGQVSSYMTRYWDWQSGQSRNRRDAKPPILNSDAGCYPALYKGQCFKLHGFEQVELKVFTGSDWIWITVPIRQLRERHKVPTNQIKSPSLIVNDKSSHLSVPFECHPEKVKARGVVVAVDLGINTTSSGKRYNCDLNGSYNIAARGWLKLDSRKDYEKRPSKKSGRLPRSWACLCDLWTNGSSFLSIDTPTSKKVG